MGAGGRARWGLDGGWRTDLVGAGDGLGGAGRLARRGWVGAGRGWVEG